MAYTIVAAECTSCGACEFECPNKAIKEDTARAIFIIAAEKCTECDGHFDEPQCVSVCPAEGAIIQLAA